MPDRFYKPVRRLHLVNPSESPNFTVGSLKEDTDVHDGLLRAMTRNERFLDERYFGFAEDVEMKLASFACRLMLSQCQFKLDLPGIATVYLDGATMDSPLPGSYFSVIVAKQATYTNPRETFERIVNATNADLATANSSYELPLD
jgi:hypothetical protein